MSAATHTKDMHAGKPEMILERIKTAWKLLSSPPREVAGLSPDYYPGLSIDSDTFSMQLANLQKSLTKEASKQSTEPRQTGVAAMLHGQAVMIGSEPSD